MYAIYRRMSAMLKSSKALDSDQFKSVLLDFVSVLESLNVERSGSVYLHVLCEDLEAYATWWGHFGFGLGTFSSSTSEHANKFVKKNALNHSNKSKEKYKQVLRRHQVCVTYDPYYCVNAM